MARSPRTRRWTTILLRELPRQRTPRRRLAAIMLGCLALLIAAGRAAGAADTGAAGVRDLSWAAPGVNGPTGEKPQSKVWFNDGVWWADMFDVASGSWHIFRLNGGWTDTGTQVDERPGSWADTLWDGAHLYVASAGRDPANGADSARLYRYSYSSATKQYTLDAGYPVRIAVGGMEAVVLDRDSTGTLWATWTRGNQVYVNATTGDDAVWGTPFVLPVAGTTVAPDDIASVVAFAGHIGVMWSNQVDDVMYFAVHRDGDPPGTWSPSERAVQGPKMADDHINLKSLNGVVFAVTKTSLSDLPTLDPSAPLVLLLRRNPTTGAWTRTVVSTVAEDQSRPILVLDPARDQLSVVATTRVGGGSDNSGTALTAISSKSTSISAPSFAPGPGTPLIRTDRDQNINNATSTKQTVGAGAVVLASDNITRYYMHGVVAPPPCPSSRQARVRWTLPQHRRMASIVVRVARRAYRTLHGNRHAITVQLRRLPAPVTVEVRARATTGKVYAATRTYRGCRAPARSALHLAAVGARQA